MQYYSTMKKNTIQLCVKIEILPKYIKWKIQSKDQSIDCVQFV